MMSKSFLNLTVAPDDISTSVDCLLSVSLRYFTRLFKNGNHLGSYALTRRKAEGEIENLL